MIYSFIHGNDKRLKYLLILLILFTTQFVDIIVSRFANPMFGWHTGFSVLYYVLGFAILGGRLYLCEIKTWIIGVIAIVACLLQWGYNWILIEGPLHDLNAVKMWVYDIVWDGYNAPFIVILTVAICMLFQRVQWREWKWLQFVGVNSLAIFLMQTPMFRIWRMILPLDEWTALNPVCGIILPILTLASCMAITYILNTNKYSKYMISI